MNTNEDLYFKKCDKIFDKNLTDRIDNGEDGRGMGKGKENVS